MAKPGEYIPIATIIGVRIIELVFALKFYLLKAT